MDASLLKEKVLEDHKVEDILIALRCHKIKNRGEEYRAALPDGNNATAVQVYLDNLTVKVHTRDDFQNEKADIITLVEYLENLYFSQAINWICQVCGYDYYGDFTSSEEDPCLLFFKQVEPKAYDRFEEVPLKKYPESILNEFRSINNKWFLNDGISLRVQTIFELGISYRDDRITIPIRDELGNLVGVKGRTTLDLVGEVSDLDSWGIPKYNYIYRCPKTQILFGLDKAMPHIKERGVVYVFEAEKGVLQAWSMGYPNSVSIGGHDISPVQVLKLEKLGVDIVLCLDKDVEGKEINKQCAKFIMKHSLSVVYDKDDLLGKQTYRTDKQTGKKHPRNKKSPTDLGKETFERLVNEYKFDF